MSSNTYVLVKSPISQCFIGKNKHVHLAESENARDKFGDNACFVAADYCKRIIGEGELAPYRETIYVAVSFPESQLFMDEHLDEIFFINDQHGVQKYGNAAYFVEEQLYIRVRKNFDRSMDNFNYTPFVYNMP